MFEVIGERINTSRKLVQAAVAVRDAAYIIDDVQKQQEAGAAFIDVNAGARIGHEEEDMKWLLDTIQPAVNIPLEYRIDYSESQLPASDKWLFISTPCIRKISLF